MPVSSKIPKNAKYTLADVRFGTKVEMEHTRNRRDARRISVQHLNEHPTYYRVLPAAEQLMGILENKKVPGPRKRRPGRSAPRMPPGFYGYGT